VTVYRPDLNASGVIRPRPAALRAGAGQLLIPSNPTIAAIGKVSHIIEASAGSALPLAGPARRAVHGISSHPVTRRLPCHASVLARLSCPAEADRSNPIPTLNPTRCRQAGRVIPAAARSAQCSVGNSRVSRRRVPLGAPMTRWRRLRFRPIRLSRALPWRLWSSGTSAVCCEGAGAGKRTGTGSWASFR
jgi:hypothetical protein